MDTYFKAWREVRADSSSSVSFFSCVLEGSYRGLSPLSCALSLDASLLAISHGGKLLTLWSPSTFTLLHPPLGLPPASTLSSLARFYEGHSPKAHGDDAEELQDTEEQKEDNKERLFSSLRKEDCRHVGLLESPYGLYLVATTTSFLLLYDLISLSLCWVKSFLSCMYELRRYLSLCVSVCTIDTGTYIRSFHRYVALG